MELGITAANTFLFYNLWQWHLKENQLAVKYNTASRADYWIRRLGNRPNPLV
jgi:hypothetical protein